MELGNSSTSFDNNKNQNNLGANEMETKENNNYYEIGEYYRNEFVVALNQGYSKIVAKDFAKDAMMNKYPETKEYVKKPLEYNKFWGMIGNIVTPEYAKFVKEVNRKTYVEPKTEIVEKNKRYFQETIDDLIDNVGFVPFKNVFQSIFGVAPVKNVSQYISNKSKSGYKFEKQEFGWKVIEKPDLQAINKLEAEIRRLEIGHETLLEETDKVKHELDQKQAELKAIKLGRK